jgi:1-acyl-sn-glycerol-3-phosphate acyltransferase
MKIWCSAGLYFYFKKWQINNAGAVRVQGPVIFIPTHQNAFLDAVLAICSSPRNPWSIARASVFKAGLVTKLLTAIQIKPVFRIRDGWSSLKNNDAIMQEWIQMLAAGHDIMIFAEGNHNEPYASGTLQRGFARMALKFHQQYNTPLTIIPVGIYYENHLSFRSRVLVNYGEPIDVGNVVRAAATERDKLDNLVTVTTDGLHRLALAIDPAENYKAKFDFLMKFRKVQEDLLRQMESDRALLEHYPKAPAHVPMRKQSAAATKFLNPVVWIGWLLNIIPYSIIRGFIRKNVKDPQFIGSLKYAFGIFLVPVFYVILITLLYVTTDSIALTLVSALLLPFTGIFATDILKK